MALSLLFFRAVPYSILVQVTLSQWRTQDFSIREGGFSDVTS